MIADAFHWLVVPWGATIDLILAIPAGIVLVGAGIALVADWRAWSKDNPLSDYQ